MFLYKIMDQFKHVLQFTLNMTEICTWFSYEVDCIPKTKSECRNLANPFFFSKVANLPFGHGICNKIVFKRAFCLINLL